MKLSLSGRLWETRGGYRAGLLEQVEVAKRLGYAGLEVRYPLLPEESAVAAVRARMEAAGIVPSLAFCAKVPVDAASREDARRVVRTLRALGGDAVRLAVMKEEQLPGVRELAEDAAREDVRLLVHVHVNTFCDTPAKALHLLGEVAHPNVRLLVDPAQLALSGERDLPSALERLFPHTGFVNLQDFRRTAPGEPEGEAAGYDGRWTRVVPGQAGGFDWRGLLGTLARLGYGGWLNVMCATLETDDPVEVARGYLTLLRAAWPAKPFP